MRHIIYRAFVSAAILIITLIVSIIWQKMVYTIPVLAVLLFFAAGLRGLARETTQRQLDQEAVEVDVGTETGMDGG